MDTFWQKLPKPFLALAPMEDVTDSVLRRILISVAKPDVCFTEFVNVDGVVEVAARVLQNSVLDSLVVAGVRLRADFAGYPVRQERRIMRENGLLQRLYFTQKERPLVAQIWGDKPENFFKAAQIINSLKFDGIDINMGCPQRKVMKTGGCAALIGKNDLVKEIIQATKEGAGELPVSVKTRIGNKKIITEDWIGFLLEQNLAAITVHGRTAAEQSKVPAHWEEIGKCVELRDNYYGDSDFEKISSARPRPTVPSEIFSENPASPMAKKTLIIGNGDVRDYSDAMQKVEEYGVDGVMIGRGIFQKPEAFVKYDIRFTKYDRIDLFKRHIKMYRETWGPTSPRLRRAGKSFYILRKFVKMYINGWEGAAKMRELIMKAENYDELVHNLDSCQKQMV